MQINSQRKEWQLVYNLLMFEEAIRQILFKNKHQNTTYGENE